MLILKFIASWLAVGVVTNIFGMLFDYMSMNKKPSIKIRDHIFIICCGYVSALILFKCIIDKIKEKKQ